MSHLRLVIRNPDMMYQLLKKIKKIVAHTLFEIVIVDLIEENKPEEPEAKQDNKDSEMKDDTQDQSAKDVKKDKDSKDETKSHDNKENIDTKEDAKNSKQEEETKDLKSPKEDLKPTKLSSEALKAIENPPASTPKPALPTKKLKEDPEPVYTHWWSDWKSEHKVWATYLSHRAKIIIEQDPKMPKVINMTKIRTYCEEEC